jgi:hypothetical protein
VRLPAGAPAELVAALEQLELPTGDPGPAEKLARPGGDRAFVLEALATEAEVRVRISSLHRPPAAYGEGTQAIAATGPRFKARARTTAWRIATQAAFADLVGRINEALGQGARRIKLSIRVNGLEPAVREQAGEKTLACLKSRLDLLGASTAPALRAGYLEEELEYVPAKDEPREPLQHHVAWVKSALLGGPKAPCTIVGTVLSKYTVLVSADALNQGVIVAFERR